MESCFYLFIKLRLLNSFSLSPSACPPTGSYKVSVLVITYLAYMCYHMTRKPISVVKAVLQNCTVIPPRTGLDGEEAMMTSNYISTSERHDRGCAYPPFGEYI